LGFFQRFFWIFDEVYEELVLAGMVAIIQKIDARPLVEVAENVLGE
jgi:hypothetical protein